jgi:peptide deformylase
MKTTTRETTRETVGGAMRRELFIHPSDHLTKASGEIFIEGVDVVGMFADMASHLVEQGEKVIASNQIGEHVPIILVLTKEGMCPMITPHIIRKGNEIKTESEWCSSIPNKRVRIPRHRVITVAYTTIEGVRVTEVIKGETARLVQHGVDHLLGKTILDYL